MMRKVHFSVIFSRLLVHFCLGIGICMELHNLYENSLVKYITSPDFYRTSICRLSLRYL